MCRSTRRKRFLGLVLLAFCLAADAPPAGNRLAGQDAEAAAKSWQGTWNNRKHRSSGPLKCTARKQGDSYEARFEGTFMGSPFEFTVPVTATPRDDRTLLEGVATVDGDRYEWSGYVRGGALHGSYRSQLGNNGEFRLQELRN
jgi:hypothetical protein